MKPYVPEETNMREFTLKAVVLGILMAVVLGATNAYLGLKAGMTISAVFPAAIVSIAAFRLPFLKGTILEQNIARSMAAVGEALVAGVLFTVPAFVIVNYNGEKIWTSFKYWPASLITLLGGVLGILIIIILRRVLCNDKELRFPEGLACYEIVKSGQRGESGAKYVFGALGIGALIELLKNSGGIKIFQDVVSFMFHFPKSVINNITSSRQSLSAVQHEGNISFTSPLASPAIMSVGYIIGPKYAAICFSGAVLAWLILIPLIVFTNPGIMQQISAGQVISWDDVSFSVWYAQVRPIAVGTMLVGAFFTLFKMKNSLVAVVQSIFKKHASGEQEKTSRLDKDLSTRWIVLGIIALLIPISVLFYYFSNSVTGAIVSAVALVVIGFVLSIIGGWIVGIIGNSNQPLSGLVLSCLLITALLLVAFGVTGIGGIAAVLGVAAVISCAISMSGDIIQDLKTSQLIGATPWKVEIAGILSVVVVSFVTIFPIAILHEANLAAGGIGIGDPALPAPQAGLMAQIATGVVGGQMPWALIIIGIAFGLFLILIGAPSPMVIALGAYLPFETSFAIFIGGIIAWILEVFVKRKKLSDEDKNNVTNRGILVASGFIAGEALMGVSAAVLVLFGIPSITQLIFGVEELPILGSYGQWLSLIIFAVVAYGLIKIPMKARK